MAGDISVRKHVRRRGGRTARIAAVLGFDPIVNVTPYKRRRPVRKLPEGWEGGEEMLRKSFGPRVAGEVRKSKVPGHEGEWYWLVLVREKNEHKLWPGGGGDVKTREEG